MSGNVGSERRLEYAAVGDTTNTAARLEQMTKETGRTILLSDSTRSALGRIPGDLVQVGEVTPRGRQAPVVVWALPASEGVASAVLKRSL
jgi:adenylate cyclase